MRTLRCTSCGMPASPKEAIYTLPSGVAFCRYCHPRKPQPVTVAELLAASETAYIAQPFNHAGRQVGGNMALYVPA